MELINNKTKNLHVLIIVFISWKIKIKNKLLSKYDIQMCLLGKFALYYFYLRYSGWTKITIDVLLYKLNENSTETIASLVRFCRDLRDDLIKTKNKQIRWKKSWIGDAGVIVKLVGERTTTRARVKLKTTINYNTYNTALNSTTSKACIRFNYN